MSGSARQLPTELTQNILTVSAQQKIVSVGPLTLHPQHSLAATAECHQPRLRILGTRGLTSRDSNTQELSPSSSTSFQ